MQAVDVMTPDVATVTPETSVEDVARIFLRRHISAVPVVDDNGVLQGIVSEGDLMRRTENDTERRPSWWLHMITGPAERAREFVLSHGHHARDVMTRKVVTIPEDMPVSQVAELLETHRIKRVPVVRDGKVVGIVSRANLLQGLAALKAPGEQHLGDRQIRESLAGALAQDLPSVGNFVSYVVRDGKVQLWGGVLTESEKTAVRVAAEGIAGVQEVEDNVTVLPNALQITGGM
ncbi:MAG: CBS domain-containing protein [Rhodospirillaceae bacterium]|nr:CBS domain-containing protein [Rhodospirillaceae bacterium]MBT5945757.1 CBS domain-containing protein [Rhodospirillaceae bacterium]MBT6403289.1 CBS domain-containing protein [Rhodospirillaceae bacterium]MBT6536856.1 CBS domain-containing protein [Rhodospirillaceae bacterium]MBT7362037.1 CBS domain-containing protein [Rhodospirillaceae bacterium]